MDLVLNDAGIGKKQWERRRSSLCHDWIKNAMLIGISRMKNIVSGAVFNDEGREDMLRLLNGADEQFGAVRELLAEAESALGPVGASLASISTSADMACLLEGANIRWKAQSGFLDAKEHATSALESAAECISECSRALSLPGAGFDVAVLDTLQRTDSSLRDLAAALAGLGRIKPWLQSNDTASPHP